MSLKLPACLTKRTKLSSVQISRIIMKKYHNNSFATQDIQTKIKLYIVVALLLLFSIQSLFSRTTMEEKHVDLLVIVPRQ